MMASISTYIFVKYLGVFYLSVFLVGIGDTVMEKVGIMFRETISKK